MLEMVRTLLLVLCALVVGKSSSNIMSSCRPKRQCQLLHLLKPMIYHQNYCRTSSREARVFPIGFGVVVYLFEEFSFDTWQLAWNFSLGCLLKVKILSCSVIHF